MFSFSYCLKIKANSKNIFISLQLASTENLQAVGIYKSLGFSSLTHSFVNTEVGQTRQLLLMFQCYQS